jgi:hypothetical protein
MNADKDREIGLSDNRKSKTEPLTRRDAEGDIGTPFRVAPTGRASFFSLPSLLSFSRFAGSPSGRANFFRAYGAGALELFDSFSSRRIFTDVTKQNRLPKQAVEQLNLVIGEGKSYPAFSIVGREMSRRSTISLVTSNSFTRFWLGR